MRNILLIALAGLAIFATAATAHQNGWGNNHMRGTNMNNGMTRGSGCQMGGNMNGQQMMNRNQVTQNGSQQGIQNQNWRINPSYQGQTAPSTSAGK